MLNDAWLGQLSNTSFGFVCTEYDAVDQILSRNHFYKFYYLSSKLFCRVFQKRVYLHCLVHSFSLFCCFRPVFAFGKVVVVSCGDGKQPRRP